VETLLLVVADPDELAHGLSLIAEAVRQSVLLSGELDHAKSGHALPIKRDAVAIVGASRIDHQRRFRPLAGTGERNRAYDRCNAAQ
jgi:hypothetical protein